MFASYSVNRKVAADVHLTLVRNPIRLKAKQTAISEVQRRENRLFAVGHMSLAYLLGKGSAKWLKVKINIPLIMVLSILPDADIIADKLTGSSCIGDPAIH